MRIYKLLYRLSVIVLLLFGCSVMESKDQNPKCPYRVIYSNDTTNILSCNSPYNTRNEGGFTDEKLKASIEETVNTGIEVHMLEPGLGWVPWWKSQSYPYEQHAKWYKERFGRNVNSFGTYMLAGGDMVATFVETCRKKNIVPFVSLRMNDHHYKERVDFTKEQVAKGLPAPENHGISKFYDKNPQYRIGPKEFLDKVAEDDPKLIKEKYYNTIRPARVFNWVYSEVRQQKLDFIKELCSYDISGLQLDFMRHKDYFPLNKTTLQQRCRIMVNFIAEARKILDQSTPLGQHRWLAVRIPFRYRDFGDMGVDVKMFSIAGVDIFNLSCDYVMEQQTDLAKIAEEVPNSSVYLEMSFVANRYRPKSIKDTNLNLSSDHIDIFIRPTLEQYYTAAYLAYSRGACGVTMFNFQYFRMNQDRLNGRIVEPPFEVFQKLGDRQWLSKQPQHYYLSKYDAKGNRVTKEDLVKGVKRTYYLDMASPSGGWINGGRLRIQMLNPSDGSQSVLRFNGTLLSHTDDISEPYSIVHPEGLGNEETLRAWSLPPEIIIDGYNKIEFIPSDSDTGNQVIYLDIAVR